MPAHGVANAPFCWLQAGTLVFPLVFFFLFSPNPSALSNTQLERPGSTKEPHGTEKGRQDQKTTEHGQTGRRLVVTHHSSPSLAFTPPGSKVSTDRLPSHQIPSYGRPLSDLRPRYPRASSLRVMPLLASSPSILTAQRCRRVSHHFSTLPLARMAMGARSRLTTEACSCSSLQPHRHAVGLSIEERVWTYSVLGVHLLSIETVSHEASRL